MGCVYTLEQVCQSVAPQQAVHASIRSYSPKSTIFTRRLTAPGIWWLKRLPRLRRDLQWQIWTQWWTRGASASQHRWAPRSAQPTSHCRRIWCTARKENTAFTILKRRLFRHFIQSHWKVKSVDDNSSCLCTYHVLSNHTTTYSQAFTYNVPLKQSTSIYEALNRIQRRLTAFCTIKEKPTGSYRLREHKDWD